MKTSESVVEISKAMHKAQMAMTAAIKDADQGHFKSKYADLGNIILAIKGPFADNGLSYIQCPEMEEAKVGVTTRIMHESGEWLESTLLIPMQKLDPQGAGSAITYARRYSLQAMAGIPAADDDAEFAMGRIKKEPEPTIEIEQVAEITTLLKSVGYDQAAFLKAAKVERIGDITVKRMEGVLKHIESKRPVETAGEAANEAFQAELGEA